MLSSSSNPPNNIYNVSTTHPIINNSRQYIFEKKFVSINANDRDLIKYPLSSNFDIELPQDYINVQTIKLNSWTFPNYYKTFSNSRGNIDLLFKITQPYNPRKDPNDPNYDDQLHNIIYQALNSYKSTFFVATITEGFYTPSQMANMLTNSMNMAVTNYLVTYLQQLYPSLVRPFLQNKASPSSTDININGYGYLEFIVRLNEVTNKLWFGNKSSKFQISNTLINYQQAISIKKSICKSPFNVTTSHLVNWGLPWYLGFDYQDYDAVEINPFISYNGETPTIDNTIFPVFLHNNINIGVNTDYAWIRNTQYGSIYVLEAPEVINLDVDNSFFVEINGMNAMDETKPYTMTNTYGTNSMTTSGTKNSAFAKIPVIRYGNGNINYSTSQPIYKYFDPPAERIKKISIKIRHHDGSPVLFGNQDFSLTFEFGMLTPHNEKSYSIQVPEAIRFYL